MSETPKQREWVGFERGNIHTQDGIVLTYNIRFDADKMGLAEACNAVIAELKKVVQ